jgi:hypothetical protein
MTGKVDDPGAFCGGLAHRMGYKPKRESDVKQTEKKHEAEDHDDVEKDKALIMDMIRQYLGGEEDADDEMTKMAKEAYEAYKEMGYEKEEAMKAAGHAMKLAKHMAKKKKEAGILASEDEAKLHKEDESESEAEDESKRHKEDESESESEGKRHKEDESESESEGKRGKHKEDESEAKESSHGASLSTLRKIEEELAKIRGENAKLRESLKKRELQDYIEEKLSRSKMPRESTKKFKESLLRCRSKEEIDGLFEVFMEGYKQAGDRGSLSNAFFLPEKTANIPDNETGVVSLRDCVTE